MNCGHTGFHSITSRYDSEKELLVYVRVCDRCGRTVCEVQRLRYRPRFRVTTRGGRLQGRVTSDLE